MLQLLPTNPCHSDCLVLIPFFYVQCPPKPSTSGLLLLLLQRIAMTHKHKQTAGAAISERHNIAVMVNCASDEILVNGCNSNRKMHILPVEGSCKSVPLAGSSSHSACSYALRTTVLHAYAGLVCRQTWVLVFIHALGSRDLFAFPLPTPCRHLLL